jgi:aminoglycoside 6'-N-acetyltransferase
VADDGRLSFRPLVREDFPLLRQWLAEPLVARWWNHEATPEALERDFGPSIDGLDGTRLFVVTLDRSPIGLIQRYRIDSEPEYRAELDPVCFVPVGALSIDYLIGEPGARHRGIGSRMIAEFVDHVLAEDLDADDVLVPVAEGNVGSWRALENAGFVRVASGELSPDNPIDPPAHHVYRFRRRV